MNKWMIWGAHPYFWKHPYMKIRNANDIHDLLCVPSKSRTARKWDYLNLRKAIKSPSDMTYSGTNTL